MPLPRIVIQRREPAEKKPRERRPVRRLPVALGAATVLLGGLAVWFADEASAVRDQAGAHNVALTDPARTSEVTGQVTDAVNALFSYDYSDAAKSRQAAATLLTGRAVGQYDRMLAPVRAQAGKQKLVLTTTVTDSAVEMLEGDRARLLVFADQRNTRTSGKGTTYAAAMLAVDASRLHGSWKIANIDTLAAPR
jgi:Mce-associated membrane protein